MTSKNVGGVLTSLILPWKKFFLLVVAVALVVGMQTCTAHEVKVNTVTAENVVCTIHAIANDGNIQLTCPADGVTSLKSPELALDYALNPRELTCTLYKGMSPDCRLADNS